jgi:hypothetical protein
MDTKPLFSGTVATIVGTIGILILGASAMIPAPWGFLVGLVGFLMAGLAGMSAKPPAFVEGKPVLQGVALTIATSVAGLLVQFWSLVPQGWPQSIALALAGILSWLTGHALPQLGGTSIPVAVPMTGGSQAAADAINGRAP